MKRIALIFLMFGAVPAAAEEMLPGQWEATMSVQSMEGAKISPQMKEMMSKRVPTVAKTCLTLAQIKNGPQDIEKNSKGSCKILSYSVGGGKVSNSMMCKTPGGTIKTTTSGTYTAKTYDNTVRTISNMAGVKATTVAVLKGRWLGACATK